MFHPFSILHIPPLLIATATTFGGLWPFINPHSALLEFGFPKATATSKPAQSVMVVCSARTTATGASIFAFYYMGDLKAVDVMLMVLGYVGAVDAYVCYGEGMRDKAVLRGVAGGVIALWGVTGMTGGW
ncbi:hypothetical protein GLAREA_09500 [Glarea lozoyensis ATCC 20868]|uniref:Uncharacterized protein n=1 Tax=Glarea lozoyensis (strain ATCC 20868 / MF5171) TaxID=1116229 RepID=S3CRT6_GLAL2|nr:uncharacterized protein GLAREA_09500 [Glarea lozoyensis ATCC 20868]EPE28380.1 hypothetical protein GLAREA_09500 [Glarea lozoyensis ATCC 20868]